MLSKALGDAAQAGLIDSNPVPLSTPPIYRKPRPMPPTVAQLGRILAALEGDRLEMLYRLIAATGLRHGEALGLRWQDLTLSGDTPEMRITGKLDLHEGTRDEYAKTAASAGALPLDRELVEIFEAQAKRQAGERERAGDRWRDSGLVFSSSVGTPMDPDNVRRRIRDAAARTGVAQERREAGLRPLRIHDLRHAFAQHAIDADPSQFVGVSKYLRHASIRVTADLYTAPSRALLTGVRRTVTRHREANGRAQSQENKGRN
jgi:integrase